MTGVLTRSQSRASNQPVFIDDQWNDAYIQTKDEQIDAMQSQKLLKSWYDSNEEDSDDTASDSGWDSEEWDDDEDDDYLYGNQIGLFGAIIWTTLSILALPMFIYALFVHPTGEKWPLNSTTMSGTFIKAYSNIAALILIGGLAYWGTCTDNYSAYLWSDVSVKEPQMCKESLLNRLQQCQFVKGYYSVPESCEKGLIQGLVIIVSAVGTLFFYRTWLKCFLLFTFFSYTALNIYLDTQIVERVAQRITSVDPTFAFANEPIFVAIDGHNLEDGGMIAWIPYWGGLESKKPEKSARMYPQVLSEGGVKVTFDQLNEYVPCYQSTDSTGYQCFSDVRLRVKDKKSVPGWSLSDQKHEEL